MNDNPKPVIITPINPKAHIRADTIYAMVDCRTGKMAFGAIALAYLDEWQDYDYLNFYAMPQGFQVEFSHDRNRFEQIPEHYEVEYDREKCLLEVFEVDDTMARNDNMPHDPMLVQPGTYAALINDFFAAYMANMGPGRYNTERHIDWAHDIATALAELFYGYEREWSMEKGLWQDVYGRIDDNDHFQEQCDAAVHAVAVRSAADARCTPERAIELVCADPKTGRTQPEDLEGD